MTKVNVVLEFDSETLGEQWMNIDNLKTLLYTMNSTGEHLLKVVSYNDFAEALKEQRDACKVHYLNLNLDRTALDYDSDEGEDFENAIVQNKKTVVFDSLRDFQIAFNNNEINSYGYIAIKEA